jgi:hypothetical protein
MPQQEKSIIRSLLDPTVVLDTMEINDLDTGTSPAAKEIGQEGQDKSKKVSKSIGSDYPFIEINNYVFSMDTIEKFEIDYTGFIPTVRLVAFIKSKTFTSEAIPKDGDRMAVFIRAKNDVFKPIRNDYRITSVRQRGGNNEGTNAFFDITGELWVPHLYDPLSKAYSGTSYEVLKEIAKELGLGFASNDTETSDSQVWINPRGNYYDLIQDIAAHAWKDDDSFFSVFIDVYYHLNFINVNNQFSEDTNLDLQLLVNMTFTDADGGKTTEQQLQEGTGQVPKVLSNYTGLIGSPAYVHRYNIENNSNIINEELGYKLYTTFFEQNSEQYWSIYTEPKTTPGAAENKMTLKGRITKPGAPPEEFYKTQVKYEWGGIQYSAPEGNAHEKYAYAEGWNKRNNAELEKMVLNVALERGNFNIYRGERLPVFLIVSGDNQYQNIASPPEQENKSSAFAQPIADKFYSGYYMISGMKFGYSPQGQTNSDPVAPSEGQAQQPGFTHTVYLTRREWPSPV